jgi:hypothetical protein
LAVSVVIPREAFAQSTFQNELLDLRFGGAIHADGVGEGFFGFKDKLAEFRSSRQSNGHEEGWMHFAAGESFPTGEEIREGFVFTAEKDNRPLSEQDGAGIDAACYASIKGRFQHGDWYVNYPLTSYSQGKRCYPYIYLKDPQWPLLKSVKLTGRLTYSFDPKQGLSGSVGLLWSRNGLRILVMNNLAEASFGLKEF